MPTLRRSTRSIRGTPKPGTNTSNPLPSLAEDEASPASLTPAPLEDAFPTVPTTPLTSRIKPPGSQMNPSKAQQSTAKAPDSGLRLGFTDIDTLKNQQTPSKTMPVTMTDSSFDFRFARPGPQLSAEAQKMMDGLREEALRVKARLVAERDEAAQNAREDTAAIAARRFAQPKGKAGRFSDVHMAEFKKMDSIAGHPSSFRAQPGRISPAKPAMKRTQSKANLDEREDLKDQQIYTKSSSSGRLENEAPAKRARKGPADDTSTARPVSRDTMPSTPQKQASTLAHLTTPTQSSIARAASVKSHTTQIPTLSRSPSKPNLVTASTPNVPAKSAFTNPLGGVPKSESKSFLRTPGKVDRLKSILRYPGTSPRKQIARSALPVFTLSPTKPDFNKELPAVPTTPRGPQQPNNGKLVSFTPDVAVKNAESSHNSPSPMKSGIPRSASRSNFFTKTPTSQSGVPAFRPSEVHYPSLSNHPSVKEDAKSEHRTLAGARPLPVPPRSVATQSQLPRAAPGTFTFRSDHTINFGQAPTGFGSSPGQASVRQVRQSLFPKMPGSFPVANKENTLVPSVPHGLPNKKRHRADSEENEEEEVERSPKKLKSGSALGSGLMSQKLEAAKGVPSSKTPSPKKKGLSLSRLNMLSRPKVRK